MKANRGQVEKAFDAQGAAHRLTLLYGPDEAGSRALLQRLVRAMGPGAERIDLDGPALKADPARLADEAASLSLFGDKRYIVVAVNGDEALAAVESLMDSAGAANPVVLIAGTLKPSAALLKRLLPDPDILCLANYVPDESSLAQIASGLAREQGMRIDNDTARRLVALSGSDRAVMAREIEKLALYLDSSPATPREATLADLSDIGAALGEPDLSGLTDAVFGGKPDETARHLASLAAEGVDGIGVLRALNKRIHLLLKLRGEMERGKSLETLVKPLFWKEQGPVSSQVRRWSPVRLATAAQRLLEAERMIKSSKSAGPILADAELITIARAARR
jgi:DNA polymerase III subunit delta